VCYLSGDLPRDLLCPTVQRAPGVPSQHGDAVPFTLLGLCIVQDPQTLEQMKEDPKDLRRCARAADWQQMRMLLRRMPVAQICSGATSAEGGEDEIGEPYAYLLLGLFLLGLVSPTRPNILAPTPSSTSHPYLIIHPHATGNSALHFAVSINHLRGVKKLLRCVGFSFFPF
jgi:hypothetical protein